MKLFKRFKNIKLSVLLVHLIVTLGYPAAKAAISTDNRLLIFTDSMTIVAFVLLIGGVFYWQYLRGDFDLSGFYLKRGLQKGPKQSFAAYWEERKAKREEAFNYPLFLSLVYLAAAGLIAYGFL